MAILKVAFLLRNPRSKILLGFFLACSILLLTPWKSTPLPDMAGKFYSYLPNRYRGMSLEEFVQREEDEYQVILKGREDFIRQNGPTPDKVDAFPPRDVYYVLWDFFIAGFNCPHSIRRMGNFGDGGKWICGVERLATQHSPCVIYSFGVNEDSSFEAAFLRAAPNCQVWGYDFSVSKFGPQVHDVPELRNLSHFYPYTLAPKDKPNVHPPQFTIQTLMERNDHKFIDILKIDIEGAEFATLEAFLRPFTEPDGPILPIGQMEIEIHASRREGNFGKFNAWWELIEKSGLRPFWTEPNLPYVSQLRKRPDLAEYSFINIKGRHALITDKY